MNHFWSLNNHHYAYIQDHPTFNFGFPTSNVQLHAVSTLNCCESKRLDPFKEQFEEKMAISP